MRALAQRRFSFSDQKLFASVSGDQNPLHVDHLLARRTQGGEPVVHGINLLLWALDCYAKAHPDLLPLRSCSARFDHFVYLGERVDVLATQEGSGGAQLNLSVDNGTRVEMTLEFGEPAAGLPGWVDPSSVAQPVLQIARERDIEELDGRAGVLAFHMTQDEARGLFPAAERWLGARRIMALAASTYLVGMECPGLHSLYSSLSFSSCPGAESLDGLAFRVSKTYPRLQLVKQEIAGGGLVGTVSSFVRTSPVQQATMQSLSGVVENAEFAGSVALIVGGTRGLGELTAKLVASGGGRVFITWRSGKEDAERVAEEIRLSGGACETFCYDTRESAEEQLSALPEMPTHAYYFATPPIFRVQSDLFLRNRLDEFLAVYVDGFWQLSKALRIRQPNLSIFYPSSVAVTERPRGMTEYAMAKAAGEMLCTDMNASLSPIRVTTARLPRLPTDQTASVTVSQTADPVSVMLPIVREVQSWPKKSS